MSTVVRLIRGDLAKTSAQVLVTSANDALVGNDQNLYWRFTSRRNVDGAVREAAGPELRAACLALPALEARESGAAAVVRDISRWEQTCKRGASATLRVLPGDAVTTRAFGALNADYVVHAVAPDSEFGFEGHYQGQPGERGVEVRAWSSPPLQRLESAYASAFREAAAVSAESLALPALGSGVKGWRPAISAAMALEQLAQRLAGPGGCAAAPREISFVLGSDDAWIAWQRVAALLLGPADDGATLTAASREPRAWHLTDADARFAAPPADRGAAQIGQHHSRLRLSLVPELSPEKKNASAKAGWAGEHWKPTNNGW